MRVAFDSQCRRWMFVLSAAVLLAASPSFLFQLTSAPMSDIPATAWCTLALATVLVPGRWAALASGAAHSGLSQRTTTRGLVRSRSRTISRCTGADVTTPGAAMS